MSCPSDVQHVPRKLHNSVLTSAASSKERPPCLAREANTREALPPSNDKGLPVHTRGQRTPPDQHPGRVRWRATPARPAFHLLPRLVPSEWLRAPLPPDRSRLSRRCVPYASPPARSSLRSLSACTLRINRHSPMRCALSTALFAASLYRTVVLRRDWVTVEG